MAWVSIFLLMFGVQPQPVNPEVLSISGVVLTLMDQADVPSREAGVLVSQTIHEGQVVEEGQILGQIDDRDAQLKFARARSELRQAEDVARNDIQVRFAAKAAEVAEAEWQRASDAASKLSKSVSQTELDRLRLLAEKARLEIEQARIEQALAERACELKQHDVDLAALSVAHRQIKAPLTGVVVQWKKQQGEWVEPGAAVVRIIRLNRLKAEGFAPANRLSAEHLGTPMRFLITLPGRGPVEFPGELTFVSPEIDPVNGQVRFWAEIDNSKHELRPGLLGSLECHLPNSPQ